MSYFNWWDSFKPSFDAKLDDARKALREWQPIDPVEYTDSWETDQSPEPIYSDRDVAEYNRLLGVVQRRTYELNMARYRFEWQAMHDMMAAKIADIEREVKDAIANSRWDYQADDNAENRRRDDELASRVSLYATKFDMMKTISFEAMRSSRQTVSIPEQDLYDMKIHLTEMVYGFVHRPIETRHDTDVEFDVPSSWWQMFKRDVLHRRYSVKTLKRKATLRVSAEPFSAFPELPFVAPPEWGARIDLMLPLSTNVRYYSHGDEP